MRATGFAMSTTNSPRTCVAALFGAYPTSPTAAGFAMSTTIPLSCATSSQCVASRRCRYATDRWRGDALAALPHLRPARTSSPSPTVPISLSSYAHSRGTDGVAPVLPVAHPRSRDAAHSRHSCGSSCCRSVGNAATCGHTERLANSRRRCAYAADDWTNARPRSMM